MSERAMDLLAALVLEDGRTWGEAADPVQLRDALAVLESEPRYHYLTRSRGYSKTADAAAMAVSLLVEEAPPGSRCYWAAADADQGALALDSIAGYRERTPVLRSRIEMQARKVLCPSSGATLEVVAADAASSWGLRPWLLVVDEFSAWNDTPGPRRLWESLSSAIAKVPAARMVLITSAGDPRCMAHKVLEHARTSPMWRVSEAEGPPPWMPEALVAEQRALHPAAIFAQLFLNRWTETEGAFLDGESIRACFTLPGPSPRMDGPRYVGALDLGLVNDRTALAIGHREGDAFHLDRLTTWKGTKKKPVSIAAVRDAVVEAHEDFGLSVVRIDPWQSRRLMEELSGARVPVSEYTFTSASKQRHSAALLQVINERTLRLYEPGTLERELRGLVVRTTGSGWTFDHARGGNDDQATVLGMLLVELMTGRAGGVADIATIPREGAPTVRRGDLILIGRQYLDVQPDGSRAAPAGWSQDDAA